MKLSLGGIEDIATVNMAPDKKTGECAITAQGMGYEVTIPGTIVHMSKDDQTKDLRIDLDFQGMLKASFVIESADIKAAKELMNKDVISFMIKSLM